MQTIPTGNIQPVIDIFPYKMLRFSANKFIRIDFKVLELVQHSLTGARHPLTSVAFMLSFSLSSNRGQRLAITDILTFIINVYRDEYNIL